MNADPLDDSTPWSQPWTLAAPLTLDGVGLHSGNRALVRIVPASAGHGLQFHRVDLPGSPAIPARAELVTETLLSTTLAVAGARVQTVEHLLAALWGLGITDASIEVDGAEVPVLDGSARPYVTAIRDIGVKVLPGARRVLALSAASRVDGDKSITVTPASECRLSYMVDYGHPLAGPERLELVVTPRSFANELAGARTFAFARDVEAMRQAGLARGGSTLNAIVIGDDTYSSELRFANELVRHKALDLIGDLALLGAHWVGHVSVEKGGHALHNALAREIAGRIPAPLGATLAQEAVS